MFNVGTTISSTCNQNLINYFMKYIIIFDYFYILLVIFKKKLKAMNTNFHIPIQPIDMFDISNMVDQSMQNPRSITDTNSDI